MQDINPNHLKIKVHDTYKKDEKLTTNFEPVNDEHLINRTHIDGKILKIDG